METDSKPKLWFWIVAAIALIWSAMTAMNFAMQLTPGGADALPDHYRPILENRPTWATVAFGLSALGMLFGAIAMFARRRLAVALFYIAFIATLVSVTYSAPMQMLYEFSTGEMILSVVLPLLIAAFLPFLANRTRKLGWLR